MDERDEMLIGRSRHSGELRPATQTLGEWIKEDFSRRKGDQVGKEVPNDDIQNPNSFFRVSLDPVNRDMWIGVRITLLSNGVVVSDAKWIHKERQVVIDGILRAESMTGDDAYYVYSPSNELAGSRKKELVRFD